MMIIPILTAMLLQHASESGAVLSKQLDAEATREISAGHMVGASVTVFQNGQITFSKQFGLACRETGRKVSPDTQFVLGSVSKQFTAACVMLLVQDGKLSLEDAVSKYFPELTRANEVRIRDLLNHTSGYHDWYPLDFIDSRLTKDTTSQEVADTYGEMALDFEPDSFYSYSNTGYLIAALIVQKVAGEPFFNFLKRRILDPLGMTHTKAYGTANPDVACKYSRWLQGPFAPAESEAAGWMLGAASLVSTSEDLAKWDIALMSGKVLDKASLHEMTMPRLLTSGALSNYGFGLNCEKIGDADVWSHTGGVSGSESWNDMSPTTKTGFVLLVNDDAGYSLGTLGSVLVADLMPHGEDLLDDPKSEAMPPAVKGPDPVAAAEKLMDQIEEGSIDRSQLTQECNDFYSDARLKANQARLKALGKPKIKLFDLSERGGLQVANLQFIFGKKIYGGFLYREPDGRIAELWF